MRFWSAAVIIAVVAAFTAIYRSYLKSNADKSEHVLQDLVQRLDRLEERMANLETIVLDQEKEKGFSDL